MVASGIVRGRYLLAKANVTNTAQGTVTFTPVEPDEIVDVPAETLYSRQAVEAVFDGNGWIHAQGTPVDYLRLPVGRWEVSFRQVKGTTITPFQFDVTADETVNLPAVAPIKPSPDVKFVVNELVYTETLDARDETFVARDVAVQAAADAVAPTNTVVDARIAVKRGAANGVGSLTIGGRQPDTEVNANLTPQALESKIVSVPTLTRDIRQYVLSDETLSRDGSADTSAIFNRVFIQAGDPFGRPVVVKVPAGRYRWDSTIQVRPRVGLVGAGRSETVCLPYGTSYGLNSYNADVTPWDGVVCDQLYFADFTIDGINQRYEENGVPVYNANLKGFRLIFNQSTVERVAVLNTWGTGFGFDFNQGTRITDCYAYNCGRGHQVVGNLTDPIQTGGGTGVGSGSGYGIGTGYFPVEECTITNSVGERNWGNGCFTERLVGRGAAYYSRGFSLIGGMMRGNNAGFRDAGSDGAIVQGVKLLENGYAGALLSITISEIPGAGFNGRITGCSIQGNGHGVSIRDARSGRYAIDNNEISYNVGQGIWENSSGVLGPNFIVTRNQIHDNGGTGILLQQAATIARLTIDGNYVYNNCSATSGEKAGISILSGLLRPRITGNTIYDDRATKYQDYGIDIRTTDRELITPRIQGNTLVGNGVGPMRNQRTIAYVGDYINNNIISDAPDTTPPSAPTGVTASGVSAQSYTLSWTASTDDVAVERYEVLIAGVVVATVTGTTATVTDRTPSTTYGNTVRAIDAAGNRSAASATVNVTTLSYGYADTGTRADGPLEGTSTQAGGKTWETYKAAGTVGTPQVLSNRIRIPDANGTVLAGADVGTPNMRFKATLTAATAGGQVYFAVRLLDSNNYIFLARESSTAVRWSVWQKVNSTNTMLSTAGALSLIANGDQLEAWFTETTAGVWTTLHVKINGAEVWSGVVTAHATRTRAAVGNGSSSTSAAWTALEATAA